MTIYKDKIECAVINFSPVGFVVVARDFLDCAAAYQPKRFSMVPYFLYCRAMELALKSVALWTSCQKDVKNKYWHNLEKVYEDHSSYIALNSAEKLVLRQANELYRDKKFEYMEPGLAAHGFKDFTEVVNGKRVVKVVPELADLSSLANKIVLKAEEHKDDQIRQGN